MLTVAINSQDDIYKVVLVLHILAAIVGFGAVFLNGVYASEMKRRKGPEALAIYEANWRVSKIGEYMIYAVPLLGIALVGMSDKEFEFSQTWVWLALVLYVVALSISHAVLLPSVKRIGVLMREMVAAGPPTGGPPPQVAEMEGLGKKAAAAGATLNIMLIVILSLMVFKPGY
jgi:uncharacterized membrane protein